MVVRGFLMDMRVCVCVWEGLGGGDSMLPPPLPPNTHIRTRIHSPLYSPFKLRQLFLGQRFSPDLSFDVLSLGL